jgi:uncharacterized protein DUF2795
MAKNPAFQLEHEIASAMKGIHFPVRRDDLLQHARQNKASEEVVKRLSALPDREFHSVAEVMDATNN